MSDEVLIEYGDQPGDTATLLLAAAEELGLDAYVVRNQPSDQGFRVPEDVAVKSGLYKAEKKADEPKAEKKTPAKKAEKKAAKKAPAKKAPAKKAAAKKSASKG